MRDYKDEFFENTKYKKLGLNIGFPKLQKVILGALKATYTLIGGGSGSGKSTFVDYILLNILQDAKQRNIPIKCFYYSFEINKDKKLAKLISNLLYVKYQIELSDMDILNYTETIIDEYKPIINDCYDEVSELINDVEFTWKGTNPTQIYKDIHKFANENGTYKTQILDEEKNIIKKDYIPNKDSPLVFIFIDHAKLSKKERGYDTKTNIDKISEYLVDFRNDFGYSSYLLQQFNRSISNVERAKYSGIELAPNDSDFSDTSNTYQDADVVLALFNPQKYNLKEYAGYNLFLLKGKFRSGHVLKNRYGEDNKVIGLHFLGKVNYIQELPQSTEINYKNYNEK